MIERQVTLPAPREAVWEALTEPDRVRTWFGARVEWDLRTGGMARFHDDDGSHRSGVVDAVVTHRELRFRWWSDDGGGPESEVTYTLEEVPDGTRLTVTERPSDAGTATATAATTAMDSAGAGAGRSGCPAWDLRLIGLWLQATARVPATV